MISPPAFIIKRVRYSVMMGKGTIMKMRFPLLVLLGVLFLASATVSFGLAYRENENPISNNKCLQNHGGCKLFKNHESEEWEGREEQHESRQPWRERGSRESEEEEERDPREKPRRQHQEQEQQQSEGQQGRGKEEEEEEPWGQQHQSQREREPQRGERGQRPEKREQREEKGEGQGSQSRSRRQRNPFYFSSNRFQTRYKNRNGQIRVLQRFDQRSYKLQNLQNYRIVEYESKPNTLILPHHSDAEYILVVLTGKATITVVNTDNKQAYNLERGDALRLPAGTTYYILNRDDNQNLRIVKLAIPINKPGQFDDFFPSSTENQQSYFRGFSRNTLEAAFNTRYEEIKRVLLGEEDQEQEQEPKQQSQQEGVIVRVSKEQIQELRKHAKSSSKKGKPSESGPFNLTSKKPIYSNKFGNFSEITPDKNPQLEDLELSLSYVEINKGALLLPHYNSEAIVIVVVSEGKGNLELVGLREQQQQEEEEEQQEEEQEEEEEEEKEGYRQVRRYRARLSPRDIFVIPAGYPVSINASSNLNLLGFGINAENNQRNFLAGEDDNVISQLDRPVKELAFPGSAQDVERLINNQEQSYFGNAQPQQKEEERHGRKGHLSSILGGFY